MQKDRFFFIKIKLKIYIKKYCHWKYPRANKLLATNLCYYKNIFTAELIKNVNFVLIYNNILL